MKGYDVIVVGAGPAGSTAAFFLAEAGVKVCLVDKQVFPRDKVCGDGVASPSLARLERMNLGGWLAERGYNAPGELLVSAPNGDSVRIVPDNPDFCYGRVIPRLELDEAILRQAVMAGADLLEGIKLSDFTRLVPNRVRLSGSSTRQDNVQVEGALVITADGVHASFTRSLGLVKDQPDLVAIRAYFDNVAGDDSLLEIHYDSTVMPGYVWVFPLKDGRANVGLGTYVQRARQRDVDLKEALGRFIATNPYARERLGRARQVSPLRGYPLRTRMSSVTPVADNILVAGEAAGLVNPLNGEGIGTAMISGELAAQHARAALVRGNFAAADLSPYAHALRRQIGRNHFTAAILRRLLSLPGLMNRTIHRARRDHDFAQTLFEIIVEARPMSAVLEPGFILKLLWG